MTTTIQEVHHNDNDSSDASHDIGNSNTDVSTSCSLTLLQPSFEAFGIVLSKNTTTGHYIDITENIRALNGQERADIIGTDAVSGPTA